MSEKNVFKDYRYLPKEDYDRSLKINGEKVPLYSPDKLKELYPEKDYTVNGETWEKKKRNKNKDTGRIELSQKWLYVSEDGTHSRLFRKPAAYAAVEDGGFIALLRLRFLPFLLILAILLAGAGIAILPKLQPDDPGEITVKPVEPDKEDPNMSVAEEVFYTVSGTVTKDGRPVEGAVLSLQTGSTEIRSAVTGADGAYLFDTVSDGVYNVVCTVGDSVLTKLADVSGASVTVDFRFPANDLHDIDEITGIDDIDETTEPGDVDETAGDVDETAGDVDETAGDVDETRGTGDEENTLLSDPTEDPSDVKAIVKVGENTPDIAVGGLSNEALLHMIVGKEVDIKLFANQLEDAAVPADAKTAIEELSGELEMTYFDFSVLKEIFRNKQLEFSEYLTHTKTVLEIAVPFDSSQAAGTYVFRYHEGEALRLTQLTEKPAGACRDGTYYATIDTVYIYTDSFSVYAIGYADAGAATQGSDMLIFSDGATVNVTEKAITMYYSHDKNATHSARVEVYLKGRDSDLLLGQSGIIPPGNELSVIPLSARDNQLPSDAGYEGYMLICYLDANGSAGDTNVELPLTIKIERGE